MIFLCMVLFFAWTCVAVTLGCSLHKWFLGSAIFGLLGLFVFQWSWMSAGVFFASLGMAYVLSLQTGWRKKVSQIFYKNLSHFIPKLSPTEEQALQVGDAWLEEMIFQGKLNWEALALTNTELSAEEQAFIDNETQELCQMLDEWQIQQDKDMPPEVWAYIKGKGFLGLVISKEFGGKGFSARAHSNIVLKLASRSAVAAITVMVPNSLGPGELLIHYGTEEQKKYYLPRLAKGLDLPCFALTEPEAGSDATSIQSTAVVCYHKVGGQKVLGLSVSLEKRWITLAPIASLIGAAVYVKDPEGLLNGSGQEGITCILIHRDTPNLEIGARHIPAHQPFMNGTIRGQNIFVPLSQVIGGQEQVGHGWKMLVECLSIGRSISLPAIGAASSSVAYLTTGAFVRMRRQFNCELVQFEGIQEKLAAIAGLNYLVTINRLNTLAAVDAGKKPAVASAIAKYFNTELARQVINDAMDIHGGRTVVEGPRNYLGTYYQSIPISVTVEGANLMTRNLLIFGQGSMVCHPYIRHEFYAIKEKNENAFHQAFWGHVSYSLSLFCKAWVHNWSFGLLAQCPKDFVKFNPKALVQLSSAFAWIADLALTTLGGNLKRKERLSARLADAFSYLYLALGVFADLKRQGNMDELLKTQAAWATQFCYAKAQFALKSFIKEYPIRPFAWLMRLVVLPFGQTYHMPNDALEAKLAHLMTENSDYRERIKSEIFLSGDANQPIDRMEMALQQYLSLEPVYAKIPEIRKLKFHQIEEWLSEQVQAGRIIEAERHAIYLAECARYDTLLVDEFEIKLEKAPVFKPLSTRKAYKFK
jgi:acyl-CoA dehydrogenase